MKLSKQKASLLTAVLLLLSLSITTITVDAARVRTYPNVSHANTHYKNTVSSKLLPFTANYQLQLGELDNLNRANLFTYPTAR